MKIRILKHCSLQVGITAEVGQVLDDVPDRNARALIAAGRAEEWRPLTQELQLPDRIETREPEIANREPEIQSSEPKRKKDRKVRHVPHSPDKMYAD